MLLSSLGSSLDSLFALGKVYLEKHKIMLGFCVNTVKKSKFEGKQVRREGYLCFFASVCDLLVGEELHIHQTSITVQTET